ncbi:ECF RNA polymerase sigma-E factor [Methylacidimicrobium cyclopophantes]|uniref:ECF RNA polymerase sigma-E factor n=1 Tax=Methylacidimicrobium cyclopophantes TaxID=1041766 RepID=A0A5E6M8E0_9BACT|nr:sigma-70 family RNA polymerase sigma factor [Methylacidimicrobium cyclopophantes]VVM05821.1 ECF RNA polymerase sigma-E factor [Methylacidimicrobium cyclopophantes]
MTPSDPDWELMARLAQGSDQALSTLMERWQEKLFSFLCRLTGNEESAADLAQETFVRVYEARHKVRPTGRFSTWLFTIATNLSRNLARWRRRHPTISLEDPIDEDSSACLEEHLGSESHPGTRLEREELCEQVRSAVLSLPGPLKETLVLFEYEELSYEEIAQVLGCSRKIVEMRLYRARKSLRKALTRKGLL